MTVRDFLNSLSDGAALVMMVGADTLEKKVVRVEPLKVVDVDLTASGAINENTEAAESKYTIPQGTLFFAREIALVGGRAGEAGSNGPAGFVRYPDGAFPIGTIADGNVAAANIAIDALALKLKIGAFDVAMTPGTSMGAPGVVGRAESMRPVVPIVVSEKEEIVARLFNKSDTAGSITAKLQLTGFALVV